MLDPNETMKIHEAADEQLALCRTRIQEYRAKIEELETAKADYHDKWLNAREKAVELAQANARLREEKTHHVVDWPDSEGNWWNNRASYPCRVTRSGCGELLIGSEQSDKWVGRKEWESLMGKTQWAKMSEENPLPMAW